MDVTGFDIGPVCYRKKNGHDCHPGFPPPPSLGDLYYRKKQLSEVWIAGRVLITTILLLNTLRRVDGW